MMCLQISELKKIEHQKPPGYLDTIIAAGEVHGDNVVLTYEAYDALRLKFSGEVPQTPPGKEGADTIKNFFNFNTPCEFPGCEQLREAYENDLARLGDECSSCARDDITRKYVAMIRQILET